MPIEFRCPQCHQMLRTPDESAGKRARCPQCSQIVPVPARESAASDLFAPPPQDLFGPPAQNPFGDTATEPKKTSTSDPFNPYASPAAFEAPSKTVYAGYGGELTHQTIDMGEVLNAPWTILKEEMGKCVAFGAVIFGVGIGSRVIGQILSMIFQGLASTEDATAIVVGGVIMFVGIAINIAVQIWVQAGLALFSLKMARDRSGAIGDLLAVRPFLGRYLGLTLVIGLLSLSIMLAIAAVCVGVPAAIGAAIDGGEGAGVGAIGGAAVAVVVSMVALTVLFYTLFISAYFIIDRDEGITAAMRSSAAFMRGNRLASFAAMLIAGLLGFAFMCITCGIGQIFTIPYLGILSATVYLMATGQPHAALPARRF